jgi:hypothetical protein
MLFLPGIEYSFGQCDGDLIETDFDVTSALEESGGALYWQLREQLVDVGEINN